MSQSLYHTSIRSLHSTLSMYHVCTLSCSFELVHVPCTSYLVPRTLYLVSCTSYLVPCTLYLINLPSPLDAWACHLFFTLSTLFTLFAFTIIHYQASHHCLDWLHPRAEGRAEGIAKKKNAHRFMDSRAEECVRHQPVVAAKLFSVVTRSWPSSFTSKVQG